MVSPAICFSLPSTTVRRPAASGTSTSKRVIFDVRWSGLSRACIEATYSSQRPSTPGSSASAPVLDGVDGADVFVVNGSNVTGSGGGGGGKSVVEVKGEE